MECKFVVGQKVVCVDTSLRGCRPNDEHLAMLQINKIYTISEILVRYKIMAVTVKEIEMWPHVFRADRFRPLRETKTDISVFNKLLTPAPKEPVRQRVKEDA
jgi:hypothetical protein